jgi:hypothetical protein
MYYDHVIIPVVWILQVRFNGLAMRDGLAISSQNLVFNSHSSSKISTLIVPLVGFFLGGWGACKSPEYGSGYAYFSFDH